MATTADIPRLEMLQVADMVAREKGIEREEVLEAMEQAIQKAGRAKYGLEHDIRAEIDRIDAALNKITLPLGFTNQLYDLREHIDVVRRRLAAPRHQPVAGVKVA